MSSVFVNHYNYEIERAASSRQLSYAIIEAKRKAEMNNLMVGLKKAIKDVHTEDVDAMVENSELVSLCNKAFRTAEEVLGKIERFSMHLYAPPAVYPVYSPVHYQPSPQMPVLRSIPRFPQPQPRPQTMVLPDERIVGTRIILVPTKTLAPIPRPRPVKVVAPLRQDEQYKEPAVPVVIVAKRKMSDENRSGSKKKSKIGIKIKNNTVITDYFKAK